jgi:hypothetical protein
LATNFALPCEMPCACLCGKGGSRWLLVGDIRWSRLPRCSFLGKANGQVTRLIGPAQCPTASQRPLRGLSEARREANCGQPMAKRLASYTWQARSGVAHVFVRTSCAWCGAASQGLSSAAAPGLRKPRCNCDTAGQTIKEVLHIKELRPDKSVGQSKGLSRSGGGKKLPRRQPLPARHWEALGQCQGGQRRELRSLEARQNSNRGRGIATCMWPNV